MRVTTYSLRLALVFLLVSAGSLFAQNDSASDVSYCSQTHGSEWHTNAFQPLIDRSAHQTLVKTVSSNGSVSLVRVRKFSADYEVDFEYRFDAEGHLRGMYGEVIRWGHWVYESENFGEVGGRFLPTESKFARIEGGLRIAEPEDGSRFSALLSSAPGLEELAVIPCAAKLKQQPYLASLHVTSTR